MGKLTDAVRRMIESLQISSASPGHINEVLQIDDSIDLDSELEQQDEDKKQDKILPGTNDEKKIKSVLDNPSFIPSKNFSGKIFKTVGINPQQLIGAMKNPTGFGFGLLGRVGAPIAGIAIVSAIAKQVWEWMIGPGGPLDIRVKIIAKNEAFAMIDRQTRQNTRIGDRQVIIQQFQGFRNFGGFASTSTGELIRQNADRVLDIGLFDRAQGLMLSDT